MNLACPACRSAGRALSLTIDDKYRLIRCKRCATEYFRSVIGEGGHSEDEASVYWEKYKFEVYSSPDVRHDYEARYDDAMAFASPWSFSGVHSLLDVGCGIGNFLEYAQARGIEAFGSDIDASAIDEATSRGLRAVVADELGEAIPDGSMDVITLWDVIEHVYTPDELISSVLPKLRGGGLLLIETPNAGFPARRIMLGIHSATRGRVDLTAPMYFWEHKIYFTRRGLTFLLADLGCEVVATKALTSPRHKMQMLFDHYASGSLEVRLLAKTWPVLETVTRTLGLGNKLLVVARSTG